MQNIKCPTCETPLLDCNCPLCDKRNECDCKFVLGIVGDSIPRKGKFNSFNTLMV